MRNIEPRNRCALVTVLSSASDGRFADVSAVTFVFMMGALVGRICLLLENESKQAAVYMLAGQLELLCLVYLKQVATLR